MRGARAVDGVSVDAAAGPDCRGSRSVITWQRPAARTSARTWSTRRDELLDLGGVQSPADLDDASSLLSSLGAPLLSSSRPRTWGSNFGDLAAIRLCASGTARTSISGDLRLLARDARAGRQWVSEPRTPRSAPAPRPRRLELKPGLRPSRRARGLFLEPRSDIVPRVAQQAGSSGLSWDARSGPVHTRKYAPTKFKKGPQPSAWRTSTTSAAAPPPPSPRVAGVAAAPVTVAPAAQAAAAAALPVPLGMASFEARSLPRRVERRGVDGRLNVQRERVRHDLELQRPREGVLDQRPDLPQSKQAPDNKGRRRAP